MKISLRNISKQYKGMSALGKYAKGIYALKDFTTELTEGVYGLLGANGAGKTTLINIFVGILGSDGGTVLIDGQDARTLGKDFLSKIGYMPQYPFLYRDFTVMDFLLYMCALKGIPDEQGKRRALELLDIVNLSDAKDKKIGALSGGMRQRVGIVQAMLGDPEILILDEPTAGLDPSERIRFRNLISKFCTRADNFAGHPYRFRCGVYRKGDYDLKGRLLNNPGNYRHIRTEYLWESVGGDSKRGRRCQTWQSILCQQYETAGGTLFSKNRKRYAACFRRSKGFP